MFNNSNDEELSPQMAEAAYKTRLTHLKRAQEHSAKGEVAKSVEHYLTYLKALSVYFRVSEDKLSPKLFDSKNITEQLLISQVYWDLAKAYDRNPKTVKEAMRCLNQFVKFSVGFKYQRVNADIVRKHLRKKLARNPQIFKETYERVKVTSKACYIATHCYGANHHKVDYLRNFRDDIELTYPGEIFTKVYYFISPKLVKTLKAIPLLDSVLTKIILKPLIEVFIANLKLIRKK